MLNWVTKAGRRAARAEKDVHKNAERDRRSAARLVSRLVEDEAAARYRVLFAKIRIGLLIWYVMIFVPFDFFDWSATKWLWLALLIPAIAAVAYFIGGAVNYESHAADHRMSRRDKGRERTRIKASREEVLAGRARLIERSRMERDAFREMYGLKDTDIPTVEGPVKSPFLPT